MTADYPFLIEAKPVGFKMLHHHRPAAGNMAGDGPEPYCGGPSFYSVAGNFSAFHHWETLAQGEIPSTEPVLCGTCGAVMRLPITRVVTTHGRAFRVPFDCDVIRAVYVGASTQSDDAPIFDGIEYRITDDRWVRGVPVQPASSPASV